jgi:hypothetical protein
MCTQRVGGCHIRNIGLEDGDGNGRGGQEAGIKLLISTKQLSQHDSVTNYLRCSRALTKSTACVLSIPQVDKRRLHCPDRLTEGIG